MGAAGGDLNSISARPQWPEEITREYHYVSEQALDGTRQSFQLLAGYKRVWKLKFAKQTESQRQAFEGFLGDNNGGYNGFTWTHPVEGGSPVNVCLWEREKIKYVRRYNNNSWEIILHER